MVTILNSDRNRWIDKLHSINEHTKYIQKAHKIVLSWHSLTHSKGDYIPRKVKTEYGLQLKRTYIVQDNLIYLCDE